MAMYSACAVEVAVIDCLVERHEIGDPLIVASQPSIDLRLIGSSAYAASAYNSSCGSFISASPSWMPICLVVKRYCSTVLAALR